MSDTFTWSMSAIPHASSINALRHDIIDAFRASGKLPIGLVLDLLPINTPNAQELIERGSFQFDSNSFSSEGDSSHIEIFDPVLDTYYLDIQEKWAGTIQVTNDTVELTFEPPLDLELPKLAQLGIGRSKFQRLVKMTGDSNRVVSELEDSVNKSKTLLDVHLKDEVPALAAGLQGKLIGMLSSECTVSGGGGTDNWYVYERRNQQGMCVVHEGEYIYGGSIAYDKKFGPDSYDACKNYARANCPLSD